MAFDAKITKGDLVVNIKFMGKICLRYAALLAGVLIALSCLTALTLPVWTVIEETAAFPKRVVFARIIFRNPDPVTPEIAKVAMFIKCFRDYFQFRAALSAICWNTLVVGAILSSGVLCFPLAPTGSTTKMVLSSLNQRCFAGKSLSALGALDITATVSIAVFARVEPLVASVGALLSAVILFVATELAILAREYFAAFRARQRCSSGRHCASASASFAFRLQSVTHKLVSVEVLRRSWLEYTAFAALLLGYIWGMIRHGSSPFSTVILTGGASDAARSPHVDPNCTTFRPHRMLQGAYA
jgi:hypothetical protein